jgi:beta-lactam-binding protein with PASTA domain
VTLAEAIVPNFVGSPTSNVRKGAEFLPFKIVFLDIQGTQSASLDGVVVGQSPTAGEQVARGAIVRLQVKTETVVVPLIVGMTLDQAVVELSKWQLRLGATDTQPVSSTVKPGTIIGQSPEVGAKTITGGQVNVIVAAPSDTQRK